MSMEFHRRKRRGYLALVQFIAAVGVGVPADVASAESTQVDVLGIECGYDRQANTFRPVADVKRLALSGPYGQPDERVAVQFALMEDSTALQTLAGAVINGDDTVTTGTAEIPIDVTRRFRPWDGVAFGDGGDARPGLERDHAYTIRVRVHDFDVAEPRLEYFPCATLPAGPRVTVERAGSGSGTITADGTSLNCGSVCSTTIEAGEQVTLRAQPDAGSRLEAWDITGCSDAAQPCGFVPEEDVVVRPRFALTSCSDTPVAIAGGQMGADQVPLVQRSLGVADSASGSPSGSTACPSAPSTCPRRRRSRRWLP